MYHWCDHGHNVRFVYPNRAVMPLQRMRDVKSVKIMRLIFAINPTPFLIDNNCFSVHKAITILQDRVKHARVDE